MGWTYVRLTRDQLIRELTSPEETERARREGRFRDEIAPVTVKTRKGETLSDQDEFIREGVEVASLAGLRPAFKKEGSVTAGGDVKCGEVGGSVTADGDVACDAVGSGVQAGGDVHCAGVEGNVTAGGDVACGGVTGDVRSGGDVACGSVGGSVRAGGDVVCRKGGDGFVFTTGERNVEVSDVAETVEDIRQTAKGLKDSLREMFRRKPSEEE